MMGPMSRFALAAMTLVACSKKVQPSGPPSITIAAAADLTVAFGAVGEAFAKTGHPAPTFSFGSSGLLAKQVNEGAPFDVFAAANTKLVDGVVRSQRCVGDSRALYARGRITLYTPANRKAFAPQSLRDLTDPRFVRIAIANPEHAPYGKAAEEALRKEGIWDQVRPKLVFGENVQQPMTLAESGNAEVAFSALSLSLRATGVYLLVPEELHSPIEQAMVACFAGPATQGGAPARMKEARAFIDFVRSPEGRAIMTQHGFLLAGEHVSTPPH
jgi:molybdate transport system substrate-binding protein